MLNSKPQVDARFREQIPPAARFQGVEYDADYRCSDADNPASSLWGLFALVKYKSAKIKQREPGKRPNDLIMATELFHAALEQCWRAGYKSEDMARELLRIVRK